MHRLLDCLIWIFPALIVGCATGTSSPQRLCEVHHTAMELLTVHGTGVCVQPPGRYSEARPMLFPNSLPLYLRKGRVHLWICQNCREAERQWDATPGPNPSRPGTPRVSSAGYLASLA